MSYEKCWLYGKLCYRTHPKEEWAVKYLDTHEHAEKIKQQTEPPKGYMLYIQYEIANGFYIVCKEKLPSVGLTNSLADYSKQQELTTRRSLKAKDFLALSADVLQERAEEYNKEEGERSIETVVNVFNAYHGTNLTATQGWHFMCILKDVRLFTTPEFHKDSAVDGVGYRALLAEERCRETSKKEEPRE